jgi:hypothetical protein
MVARMVHGNNVNAELLPWHLKAYILKTTLRFEGEVTAFAPVLSALTLWLPEPQDVFDVTLQQSVLPEQMGFALASLLIACLLQHADLDSWQSDLVPTES